MELIGKIVAGQRLVEKLGAGGMGVVFRVEGADRAVKVLPPEFAENAALVERFEREARVLAGLTHPHIVAIREFGRTDGVAWYSMELCAGGSLRSKLRAHPGPRDWRFALDVCEQVARGLAFAHDRGIVHRDVKPENILFDASGSARVADFGLAKVLADVVRTGAGTLAVRNSLSGDGPAPSTSTGGIVSTVEPSKAEPARGEQLTREGHVLGTLEYMSPEQRRGQPVDASADIYALGVVLFELLAGRPPSGIELPSDVNPRSPAALDELVKRMIAPPERRIANGKSLLDELRAARRKITDTTATTTVPPAPTRVSPVPFFALALVGGLLLTGLVSYSAKRHAPVAPAERPLPAAIADEAPAIADRLRKLDEQRTDIDAILARAEARRLEEAHRRNVEEEVRLKAERARLEALKPPPVPAPAPKDTTHDERAARVRELCAAAKHAAASGDVDLALVRYRQALELAPDEKWLKVLIQDLEIAKLEAEGRRASGEAVEVSARITLESGSEEPLPVRDRSGHVVASLRLRSRDKGRTYVLESDGRLVAAFHPAGLRAGDSRKAELAPLSYVIDVTGITTTKDRDRFTRLAVDVAVTRAPLDTRK